ncbi:MAG: anthranilate phosphoribosyltransferase [Bacteroidetes bacterium]|jgi:anthranilate phosphoribosyltransferase|nr:anthranilate phosphoribosyltransferase [Bacteroidota bacterium]
MKDILNHLFSYKTLSEKEAKEVLTTIASGGYNDTQIAVFLGVFQMRAITLEELMGFRSALKNLAIQIDLTDFETIDLCGTGGDGKNTFNISTLTSFIVAGTGAKVTKHGNYGVSSTCGSSNVLEYFGYKFSNNRDKLLKELNKAGICFLHAPMFNPAMKNVAPVRKQLGLKTFFNILGPMINPANPNNQLIGVYSLELARMYSYVYQTTDCNYTILHNLDGYDEISLTAPFKAISRRREELLEPRDLGLNKILPDEILGGSDIQESARLFKSILENEGTQQQNSVVAANAGMALRILHPQLSLSDSVSVAQDSLDSGKALKAFNQLMELNS